MDLGIRMLALFFSFLHVLNLVSAQPEYLWGDQGEAIQNIIKEWTQTNRELAAILPGWESGSVPCVNGSTNWNGLACWGPISYLNSTNITVSYYYIIALQISDTQLQGTLPSSIGNLSNLAFLTITDNPKLTGPISPLITGLTALNTMDLHANNLTGSIPEWITGTESLTEIDFHRNRLEGSIPGLESCYTLGFLDLSENLLSGSIPRVFPLQLKTLQLAHNRFSGNITCSVDSASSYPAGLDQIPSLTTLNLSYNQLSGQLPQCLGSLTSLVTLDISNNTLSGSIDGSLLRNWTRLQYLYGDNNNFSGVLDLSQLNSTMRQISLVNNSISSVILPPSNATSLLLGGNPVCNNNDQILVRYCRTDGNTIVIVKKANKTVIIVAVTISSFILLVASIVSFVIIRRLWRKVVILRQIQEEFAKNEVQPLLYSYNDLRAATQDFHPDNKLGQGGFGVVYKGVLPDGTELAVKQLNKSQQSLTEFLNEIVAITGVRHRNLVKLKGCCVRSDQRILVYEYVENKNLAEALWDTPQVGGITLDWSTRFNILLGVAQGLAYLHKDVQPPIIHRDIKAPNILLDKDMEAKIGDFGLALLYPTLEDDHTHLSINNLAGTRGYLAPEYAGYGQVSDKIDVYSFGIVVLEVVSGRKVIDSKLNEEQRYLLEWAWELHDKGKLNDLIDPKLEGKFTEDDVKQVIQVGLLCTQFATSKRPTMPNVVLMLLGHRPLGDMHRDVSHRRVSTELAVMGSTSSLTFTNHQQELNNSLFSRDYEDAITVTSPILKSTVQY